MDIHDSQSCSQCLCLNDSSNLIKLTCSHLICRSCCFRNYYLSQIDTLSSYISSRVLTVNCMQCIDGYCNVAPSDLLAWITSKENTQRNKCKKHLKMAEVYCQQCESFFCYECISIHNDLGNSHHKLSKDQSKKPLRCDIHDSKVKLFCISCKKAICSCCVSLNHNHHPVKNLKEYMTEALENIQQLKKWDMEGMLDSLTDSMKEFNTRYEAGYTQAIKEIDYILQFYIRLKEEYNKKMKEIQRIQMNINDLLRASYEKITNELNDIGNSTDVNQIMFYNDIWISMQLPVESFGESTNKANFIIPMFTESKIETQPDSLDLNNQSVNVLTNKERANNSYSKYKKASSKKISISCLKTLLSHKCQVRCLIELPNGKLASGGYKEIKIWDKTQDYQCIQTLQGHNGYIHSLIINDEDNLVSCGEDDSMLIWDINNSYKLLRTIKEQTQNIKSVILLPDGKIASITGDHSISIRNPKDNYTCVQSLTGHKDKITAIILIRKDLIASSSLDATIRIWKPKQDKAIYEQKWLLKEHSKAVNSIIEMSDGNYMLSCSDDLTIKLWSILKGFSCIQTFDAHKDFITSLVLLSDGTIASSSADSSIKIWTQHYISSM